MNEPVLTVDFVANKLTAVIGNLDMALEALRADGRMAPGVDEIRAALAAAHEINIECKARRRSYRTGGLL